MLNPKTAFTKQKNSAKYRNIQFDLSFDEWMDIWEKSGKLNERGRGKHKYAMARKGDVGAYTLGNVEIIPVEQNSRDARTNHPKSQYEIRSKQIGTGRGWTFRNNKYQVCVSRKYIGTFKTMEEAEYAYKRAASQILHSSTMVCRVAGSKPELAGVDRG